MNISNRLKSVADYVEYRTCADVGTDHGYVPIYLMENDICDKVIAMDINEGPISKCNENIEKYNYSDRIETRISNGLQKLSCGEVESVVISGMGGMLIKDILSYDLKLTKSVKQFVLSPHGDVPVVREFLKDNGFTINRENMVYDEGKYYIILDVRNDGTDDSLKQFDEDIEKLFGRYLLETKNKVFAEYVLKEHNKYVEIGDKLISDNSNENTKKRFDEIKNYIDVLERVLKIMGVNYGE